MSSDENNRKTIVTPSPTQEMEEMEEDAAIAMEIS